MDVPRGADVSLSGYDLISIPAGLSSNQNAMLQTPYPPSRCTSSSLSSIEDYERYLQTTRSLKLFCNYFVTRYELVGVLSMEALLLAIVAWSFPLLAWSPESRPTHSPRRSQLSFSGLRPNKFHLVVDSSSPLAFQDQSYSSSSASDNLPSSTPASCLLLSPKSTRPVLGEYRRVSLTIVTYIVIIDYRINSVIAAWSWSPILRRANLLYCRIIMHYVVITITAISTEANQAQSGIA